MYAPVLATAIAGRLNEQAQARLYDPPPWDVLLAALETDPRYAVTDGAAGLPMVESAFAGSRSPISGTHLAATRDDSSVLHVAS